MKTAAIDFVRQVIEQTLEYEHRKHPDVFFGGKNQVNLLSFYEQLVEDEEIERFVETYRDLVNQQNRSDLIMNGTIIAPENPQIMNVNSAEIIPMSFTVAFRVKLKDRDLAIQTLDNMVKILKGRKRDIALFEDGKLFVVGTIANNVIGTPLIKSGDFIGTINDIEETDERDIEDILDAYSTIGFSIENELGDYYYVEDTLTNKMYCFQMQNEEDPMPILVTDDKSIMPPSNTSFTKYKVSLSFDTMRIDEPHNLNAEEYCEISFGGSATLVSANVELGNDLTKVGIKKHSLDASGTTITITDSTHWLESLEMPSGLGISNQITQLASSNFIQGKHNDGINPSIDYSFVLDKSEPLIKQWWKYARYGIQGSPSSTQGVASYSTGVSPNMVYENKEIYSSWGNVEIYTFKTKATDNIDIENTESDVLTIKLTFEIQG